MRTFVPIVTLLIAAVAGAEPAPSPEQTDRSIVRDPSGRQLSCSCDYTGNFTRAECNFCVEVPATTTVTTTGPTIRLVTHGDLTPAQQRHVLVWGEVIARSQASARVRAILTEFEIQVEGNRFEFAFTCRGKPDDRKFVRPGLTMPQTRDELIRLIGEATERECGEATRKAEVMWAGCPAEDDHDRRGLQRSANPKIRISARPESYQLAWGQLRDDLISDDLIYACSQVLLIDPVQAMGDPGGLKFNANVTLVCANDSARRSEFGTGTHVMDRPTFRRWLRGEFKRVCGLNIATPASSAAR